MNAAANQDGPAVAQASDHEPDVDRIQLVKQAVDSLDDHAIKVTAAALREHRHHGDARLLRAAWVTVASEK